MEIAIDAKRAFINKSGLGNYSRDLIRGLHEYFPENKYYLFTPETQTKLLEEKYCNNLIFPKYKTKLAKAYWRTFEIYKILEKINPDIYHGLSNELPFNIQKLKSKKIVTIHDLIFLKFPKLYSFLDRKIYLRKTILACKYADIIIATSNQTKDDLMKYMNISEKKIRVVYQSYNDLFNNNYSVEQKNSILEKYSLPSNYILTVGTIEQRKNVLNVVKAMYYYNFNLNYVIIGRCTKYCKEILNYAREKGLENRIYIRNTIETFDLPAIYQCADLFIYPSVYEGFGIPILEAFASGIPVITGDHGSTAEISSFAAMQTEVLNPKAIGAAIKTILGNESFRKGLIREGKERLKQFDKKVVTNEIMKIYKSV